MELETEVKEEKLRFNQEGRKSKRKAQVPGATAKAELLEHR